jgi:hypothetical protein
LRSHIRELAGGGRNLIRLDLDTLELILGQPRVSLQRRPGVGGRNLLRADGFFGDRFARGERLRPQPVPFPLLRGELRRRLGLGGDVGRGLRVELGELVLLVGEVVLVRGSCRGLALFRKALDQVVGEIDLDLETLQRLGSLLFGEVRLRRGGLLGRGRGGKLLGIVLDRREELVEILERIPFASALLSLGHLTLLRSLRSTLRIRPPSAPSPYG